MEGLNIQKILASNCHYDVPSKILFDFHLISVVLLIPLAALLLYSASLRRFYSPLARLVNLCLFMHFLCAGLFFYFYPYNEFEANCAEIFLSRISTILEMFAELHQVYFIAFVIGIGHINFRIIGSVPCLSVVSLVQLLQFSTFVMGGAILYSFVFSRGSLMSVEDLCTIIVAVSQIYIINQAKLRQSDHHDNFIVSVHDSSVAIFQNLSQIQLFLSLFCLACRIFYWSGYESFEDLQSVIASIDFMCTFIFFLKVLIIKEKTKVSIDVV